MHNIALNIGYSNVGLFGDVDTLRGVQLNMFSSVTRKEMRGVSMSGIVSSVKQNAYGVQMSGFISAANGNMRGVQISGIYNIAKKDERCADFISWKCYYHPTAWCATLGYHQCGNGSEARYADSWCGKCLFLVYARHTDGWL